MCLIDRYNQTTGTFTVPPGGDGFYYLSTYLVVNAGKFGRFDIMFVNNTLLCTAYTEQMGTNDRGQAACSVIFAFSEGEL